MPLPLPSPPLSSPPLPIPLPCRVKSEPPSPFALLALMALAALLPDHTLLLAATEEALKVAGEE